MDLERPVVFHEAPSWVGAGVAVLLATASAWAGVYYGTGALVALWTIAAGLCLVACRCVLHERRIFDGQTYTHEVTCFGRLVRRRQEPGAYYALRQVCFEGQDSRALLLVDRFRPEGEERFLDACTSDAEADAYACALGLDLVDTEWSEDADPAKGPAPPQLVVSRPPEGLELAVRVPRWLRWNRWLALAAGACFLVGSLPGRPAWGEYVIVPGFLALLAATGVHAYVLYATRIQCVRDERLVWGADAVTCARGRGRWHTPVSEIVAVDIEELGKKRSRLPVRTPPSWHEYQVNVTVKGGVVECFRSSDRWLVEWVAGALQMELKEHAARTRVDTEAFAHGSADVASDSEVKGSSGRSQ